MNQKPFLLKASALTWSLVLAGAAVISTVAITALGTKSAKTFNTVAKEYGNTNSKPEAGQPFPEPPDPSGPSQTLP